MQGLKAREATEERRSFACRAVLRRMRSDERNGMEGAERSEERTEGSPEMECSEERSIGRRQMAFEGAETVRAI